MDYTAAAQSLIDSYDGDASQFRGQVRVAIARERLEDALAHLKDDLGFDLLIDITCVDYLNYRDATDRFGLVYLLANTTTNERLTVRVFLNEPDLRVPTAGPNVAEADHDVVYSLAAALQVAAGHPVAVTLHDAMAQR